jgi:hypothetical protein
MPFMRPPIMVSAPVSISMTDQGFSRGLMDLHRVVAHVEDDVRIMQIIVREIFFDYVAFVVKTDDEIVDGVGGIDLHDVPKNRPIADFHHRLWSGFSLFGEAGTQSSSEDNCLQLLNPEKLGLNTVFL